MRRGGSDRRRPADDERPKAVAEPALETLASLPSPGLASVLSSTNRDRSASALRRAVQAGEPCPAPCSPR